MKTGRLAAVLLLAGAPLLAQSYEVYHQFLQTFGPPSERLVAATDGNLYGVGGGGDFGQGQIFRLVPDGSGGFSYERLYSFHACDGGAPTSLIQGTDGRFFGTTDGGGSTGHGTAFAFTPSTGLVELYSFPPDSYWGSVHPQRLVQATDGNLYGVTVFGGGFRFGTVFRLTPGGAFDVLYSFEGPEGALPSIPLMQASDGYLYGATKAGGTGAAPAGQVSAAPNGGFIPPGNGTLFRIGLSGILTVLHVFTPSEQPNAAFVEGPDGNLYWTAYAGGTFGTGAVYRSDKAGNLTVVHSFPSSADDGVQPFGGLTPSGDGSYYGVAAGGGTGGGGTVYQMTLDGADTTIASFPGADPSVTNPTNGLALTPSGMLLGTAAGGPWNGGVAFRVLLPGTGFGVVYGFGGPYAGPPKTELVQTADGTIWGTAGGGSSGLGTIFRLSGGPEVAHEFSGADGASPGNLLAAPDGNLYGVTASQGAGGFGTIFRFDGSQSFATLHDFGGTDGADPEGGLMQASDGNFYGTAASGGINGGGTLFRMSSSGTFTKLHDFQAIPSPEQPLGRILQGSNGSLYLTTFGLHGTLYQSDLNGNLTDLHDFLGAEGENPPAGVIEGSDGTLYGTCENGGSGLGTIFRFTFPSTYDVVHDFQGPELPHGGVVQASDGRLYGATGGIVFVVDPSGANFSTIHTFLGNANDGGRSLAGLLRASDGMLYGTASEGGWGTVGLVFRVDPSNSPPSLYAVEPASGPASGGVALTVTGEHFHPDAALKVSYWALDGALVFESRRMFALSPPLTPGSFNDVTVTNADGQSATLPGAFFADFLDAPSGSLFHDQIETIFRDGITAGCGGGDYCRNAPVTREQLAVLLLKVEHGSGYAPPPCIGVFPDVACPSPYADWIEQFATEEITAGCGGGFYCPQSAVPRQNAAVLLLKARHGASYMPPLCAGVFTDVPCPSEFADWIEQLAAEGITSGCGNGKYCPSNPSTRGQMAAFLVRTFGLP